MDKKVVDCAIIGGGPGGYPAAIRLAEKGKTVCLIEAHQLGGTCLNRGCIPTKAYLANASTFRTVKQSEKLNIYVQGLSFDWAAMKKRKDAVVTNLRNSLTHVIRSYGIEIVEGMASFMSPTSLKVVRGGVQIAEVEAKSIIIATGSEPKELAAFPYDGKYIHSSTTLLDLEAVPESLLVIGGGAIGCEFASIFATFGSKVHIVEALDRILPLDAIELSETLKKSFSQDGIEITTGTSVASMTTHEKGIVATLKNGKTIAASMALVCVGRRLNVDGLSLEKSGVKVEKGVIQVDEYMRTSVPHIYAIGDVVAKAMYAHSATHEGIIAAENIMGNKERMRYDAIPGVIFTEPQMASVGYSLERAVKLGFDAALTSYPMQGLGKAQAEQKMAGFAQIVVEKKTGRILGAQVVGADAETLIAEMIMAITNELTIECITDTIHPHPTFSEIWLEVASLAQGTPLHFMKKR